MLKGNIVSLIFNFVPLLFQAEVWDLEVLRANNSSWPVDATDLKEGLITVKGHTQVGINIKHWLQCIFTISCTWTMRLRTVEDVLMRKVDLLHRLLALTHYVVLCVSFQRVSEGALSPDGTVLATASHDGYIKFWQIYIEGGQDKPRWARRPFNVCVW